MMKVKYEINCGFMLQRPLEHAPGHLGGCYLFTVQQSFPVSTSLTSLTVHSSSPPLLPVSAAIRCFTGSLQLRCYSGQASHDAGAVFLIKG